MILSLQSALHAAAVDNKLLFTQLLLEHGADVDAVDAAGHRPIDLATQNKCDDCVAAITNKLGLLATIFCLCYYLTAMLLCIDAVGRMRRLDLSWKAFFINAEIVLPFLSGTWFFAE